MSQTYYTILTKLGAELLANATALGVQLKLTHMAVGDGNGSIPKPIATQTKLINEVRRATINTVSVDKNNPNQIIAEQVIPETEGGWFIHEVGLYDDKGHLIAVGNCPSTYKPKLAEGSGRTQVIRMIIVIDNVDSIALKIDPAVVLATREYVDNLISTKISEHKKSTDHPGATTKSKGFVQLNSATNSTSETEAATPLAVKKTYDLASNAVKKSGDEMIGQLRMSAESAGIKFKYADSSNEFVLRTLSNSLSFIFYDEQQKAWSTKLAYITNKKQWAFQNVDEVTINNKSVLKTGDGGLFSRAPLLASGTDLLSDDILSVSQSFTLAGNYINSPISGITGTLTVTRRYHDAGAGATLEINQSNNKFYKATAHKTKDGWVLHGWVEQITTANVADFLPVGIPQPWPTATPPQGWLKCNGWKFDKNKYPKLAKAYPSGYLPEMRGETVRGWDDGRGVDPGREILSWQGDAIRNIWGCLETFMTGATHQNISSGAFCTSVNSVGAYQTGSWSGGSHQKLIFDAAKHVPVAHENRVRNLAFLYIVKAE